MHAVLPPERPNNPSYRGCRTTFGLMQQCITNAENSEHPNVQYRELQKLEQTLRQRLHALDAKKGIPEKMTSCLDELRDAVQEAFEEGIDTDFILKGFEQMIEEDEPTLEERDAKKLRKMVPEERLKKVWEQLKEAREKNRKLTNENNDLAMRLKRVQAERDQLLREAGRSPGGASGHEHVLGWQDG
ncbi:hypothetical protein BU26DRAFT_153879 [Trematosphaeria pertusa]|uniref:Uncharacterized protein n=1 Tax=Trematosphaeria pertusa TaxID=390896 RepID=A0A6A6IY73_9PLEO|nr:uncharacterized protein BU26DRAFT_153879 [Trematosphaeria pertusa]KAF2255316.1 hypothetical protein BU26DRAFT_153879 [Trematosphaeria pertusa]